MQGSQTLGRILLLFAGGSQGQRRFQRTAIHLCFGRDHRLAFKGDLLVRAPHIAQVHGIAHRAGGEGGYRAVNALALLGKSAAVVAVQQQVAALRIGAGHQVQRAAQGGPGCLAAGDAAVRAKGPAGAVISGSLQGGAAQGQVQLAAAADSVIVIAFDGVVREFFKIGAVPFQRSDHAVGGTVQQAEPAVIYQLRLADKGAGDIGAKVGCRAAVHLHQQ